MAGEFLDLSPVNQPAAPEAPGPTRIRPVLVRFFDGRTQPTLYGIEGPASITLSGLLDLVRNHLGLTHSTKLLPFWTGINRNLQSAGPLNQVLDDKWAMVRPEDGYFTVHCLPQSRATAKKGWVGTGEIFMELDRNGVEFGPSPEAPSSYIPLACRPPVSILPLDFAHVLGGARAKKVVAQALVASLRPFRRTPDDAQETALLESQVNITWGPAWSASGTNFMITQPVQRVNSTFRNVGTFPQLEPLKLSAKWTPERVAASFDMDAWLGHVVDPSAAPEKLAPYKAYYKALREHNSEVDAAKIQPRRICDEISAQSRERDPAAPTLPVAIRHMSETGPGYCRYKLEIIPDSAAPNEKKGKLRVRVFVWKYGGPRTKGFFDGSEEWGSASRGGRNRHYRTIAGHPLRQTLEHACSQNPDFAALEAHRKKWVAKDQELSEKRSIPALMEAMERPEAPAAPQPRGLTVTMRPYQLQSLKFMMDAEQGEGGFRRHLWARVTLAGGTPFWYSPLLGRVARNVPAQAWGGFCCEEMGLGKTVEVLGLCLANPAPALSPNSISSDGCIRSRATLVVCAVSLVGQWIEEARSKTGGSLRIHMYHGSGRIRDPKRLANDFDLVVTTYATLSSDCGNKRSVGGFDPKKTPLHSIQWHRLVLDESHTCKNPVVGHTKACVALKADRRWMCTGTPINTDVQDLFGQFAVLGFAPFNNRNFFDSNVKNAFGNNVFSGGCPELLHALGAIMVRHTKRQELGGEQVLQLPPKTEELVPGKQQKEYCLYILI